MKKKHEDCACAVRLRGLFQYRDTASNMTKKKRENLGVAQEVRGEVGLGTRGLSLCSPARASVGPAAARSRGQREEARETWLWERPGQERAREPPEVRGHDPELRGSR